MLILRIRQAETAFRDGRLDEAYELARMADVRAHYRGQQLIGQLTRSLLERGRRFLADGRWQQALSDCERAAKLGGNLTDAAELRQSIEAKLAAEQRQRRQQADAVVAARGHLENGELSQAQACLANTQDETGRAAILEQQIAARRTRAEAAVQRAETAGQRRDWDAAIAALIEAKSAHAAHARLHDLTAEVTALAIQDAKAALREGRLGWSASLIDRLGRLCGTTLEYSELRRIIGQCREAAGLVRQGRLRSAVEVLRRIDSILLEAAWVRQTLDAVQQAAEHIEQVCGGPLGLLSTTPREGEDETQVYGIETTSDQDATMKVPDVSAGGDLLPEHFMLCVDGVGSCLVMREHRVTVGPISSSRHPDVGLMIEAGAPVVTIERQDEDYFLIADQPIVVNDSAVTRKLLSNGDRIALTPRGRLEFRLPNPASTSAVVELAGVRLPRSDARRIVLLDRSLVMGPGSAAHIRADRMSEPAVLFMRGDRLLCQGTGEMAVNDRVVDGSAAIPLEGHVRLGTVSFVLAKV